MRPPARDLLVLCLCGAALAVGCAHREELKRSPFITPLPEGKRQAIAAPEGSPAPSPAAPLMDESPAMAALREMQADAGGELVRSARKGAGASAAVEAARERVTLEPRSVEARLALARAYHHERILDLALEHYLAARELAPADVAVARDLGRLWVDAGSPELALPYLDEALDADSTDAESWSYRGIALDLLGRYPEGETALRRVIAVDPLRWDFFNNLGYNLLLQERYGDAAAAFESGLVLAPGHAVLQNNLGLALGLAGRSDAALEAFRRGGRESEAWNNVGVVHRALGDLERAAEAFERAYRLAPDSRGIARNVRETRMRLSLAAAPDAAAPAAAPGAVREGDRERSPEVVVPAPVSVGGRRDGASAPAPRAPRVVPILPVDLAPAEAATASAPQGSAGAFRPAFAEAPPPSDAVAPRPTPAEAPAPRPGAAAAAPTSLEGPLPVIVVRPAPPAPRGGAGAAAPGEAARGHRLELMRTIFPDLALKGASDFRERTGHEARVNRSGSTYMVQIGRDLTLDEARELRAAALRAGYPDARVRDADGRDLGAGEPPRSAPPNPDAAEGRP